jgi:hypothetical protein
VMSIRHTLSSIQAMTMRQAASGRHDFFRKVETAVSAPAVGSCITESRVPVLRKQKRAELRPANRSCHFELGHQLPC